MVAPGVFSRLFILQEVMDLKFWTIAVMDPDLLAGLKYGESI